MVEEPPREAPVTLDTIEGMRCFDPSPLSIRAASPLLVLLAAACGGSNSGAQDTGPGGTSGDGGSSMNGSGNEAGAGDGATDDASSEGGSIGDAGTGDGGQSPGAACGNGKLETDEECDDGNGRPGDGCSGICTVEPGYACSEPNNPCEQTAECGDSVVDPGEGCDYGDRDLGDGCDDRCAVEPRWVCGAGGCVETDVSVCGDGAVGVGEQCDDGQEPPEDGDGCDASCQVEPGFRCPVAGDMCQPLDDEFCGNGTVEAPEACDDGNATPGDGCSAQCAVEAGYACDGGTCEVACGDGLVVGDEACDDGDQTGGNGCEADCRSVTSGYACPVASGVGGACVEQQPGAVCPNSVLEFGEQCDDGNTVDGDGCTDCTIDDGYRCPVAGANCEALPRCGDGFVDLAIGEACDDGDTDDSNGCTQDCTVADGFLCPLPVASDDRLLGGDCRPIVCGDGVVEAGEQCDDGDAAGGNGCSSLCQLEGGWTCPLNASCQARECGDGIRAGFEECDNGDANGTGATFDGVICGADCLIVADPALCGNGELDPGEACDDGNHDLGDGCTVFCAHEPTCQPPAPCTTNCGDGIVFGGEQCDDGNRRDGDGCSASCEVETGFECTEISGDALVVPVVYRDFQAYENGGHVAFQWSSEDPIDHTPEQDIWVRTKLGTDADTTPDGASLLGKPIFKWYAACDGDGCTDIVPDPGVLQPAGTGGADDCNAVKDGGEGLRFIDADDRDVYFCGYGAQDFNTFSQWYRDVDGVNHAIVDTLILDEDSPGVFEFNSDNNFFPINGLGFGNEDWDDNFHFTSEVRYWFAYDATADATLRFRGDDDVWVFVNGSLVVDISGTHGATADSVTVNSSVEDIEGNALNLVGGEVYEIVVFQAERNTTDSNYRLTLQDFNLAASVCESTCGDGVKASNEQCDLGDVCGGGSACNDGSYGGCTAGPDPETGCKLGPYCGDGEINGSEDCDDGFNDAVYGAAPMSGCAPGCVFAPYCGDGEIAVGVEQCDGGSECEDDCTLTPRCGDGTLDAGEQCDDGGLNGSPGSECDVDCFIKCGNGSIDAGEQCDPGAGNFSSAYDGCLPEVGAQQGCILGPRCGDGVRNGPEQCDDGRNDGSYGTCAPGCVLGARCGDGQVQETAGEVCDDGGGNVTASYLADGASACTTACQPVRHCGDGAVTDGEGCDDGVNDGSAGSCTPDCSEWVVLGSCGNGSVDDGEQCDAGPDNGKASSGCDSMCRVRCGNGVRDSGEECDDGVNDGRYGTCTATCHLADYCGDGDESGPEQCDAGDDNQADPYGEGLCDSACRQAPYCGDGRIQDEHGEECDGQNGCTDECTWVVLI